MARSVSASSTKREEFLGLLIGLDFTFIFSALLLIWLVAKPIAKKIEELLYR